MNDDGGPAFPTEQAATDTAFFPRSQGMSLRDYFAAAALQGYLASMDYEDSTTFAEYAQSAYDQADAMITERAK